MNLIYSQYSDNWINLGCCHESNQIYLGLDTNTVSYINDRSDLLHDKWVVYEVKMDKDFHCVLCFKPIVTIAQFSLLVGLYRLGGDGAVVQYLKEYGYEVVSVGG